MTSHACPADMLPWSENDTGVTDEFIGEMVNIFKDFVHDTYDRSSKVIDFKSPDEILKEMDLDITEHSTKLHELVDVTKKILDLSVKTGEKYVIISSDRSVLRIIYATYIIW